ncbi:hypothetical protein C8J35_11517 [Rhizobium sp. PP-F2F-G38]|nr:hypothetical protein C8J37_12720 [Rhizobium sp. PP-WC-1G-195]PYE93248.1 hypothetical protein C8J35_11517 [Rhizobium sp. PP-F2F-G38]TCP75069.1 hypothetical protein C8J31_13416 [Rhizobium sp. PP-CC-2G-626]TCQ16171.1 hypothetical protein C8J33_1174 [Rhizobium sp. PP-CC-3G-465]
MVGHTTTLSNSTSISQSRDAWSPRNRQEGQSESGYWLLDPAEIQRLPLTRTIVKFRNVPFSIFGRRIDYRKSWRWYTWWDRWGGAQPRGFTTEPPEPADDEDDLPPLAPARDRRDRVRTRPFARINPFPRPKARINRISLAFGPSASINHRQFTRNANSSRLNSISYRISCWSIDSRGNFMTDKRSRGRPRGTGANDIPHLAKIADIMFADKLTKPTTAMRRYLAAAGRSNGRSMVRSFWKQRVKGPSR